MRTILAALGLALLAPLAVGCFAGPYVYRPDENATARLSGRPAAYYPIPPQSPHGAVRVATLGVVTLQPWPGERERAHAMHVRMTVDNNDDAAPWQVDTREQTGILDGYGQSRPSFVSASAGSPPIDAIAPGDSVTIDLYYLLPRDMRKASEIPRFDVLWRVRTPRGPVATRTSFERIRIEPPPGYYAYDGWLGPPWYDPFWRDYAFWGVPAFVEVERPLPVGPRGR